MLFLRRIYVLGVVLISCLSFIFAHPGKLDSNGGHTDHSTGEYHYHHGYPAHSHNGGQCPYSYDDKTGENSGSSSSSSSSSRNEGTNSTNKPLTAKNEAQSEPSSVGSAFPVFLRWFSYLLGPILLIIGIVSKKAFKSTGPFWFFHQLACCFVVAAAGNLYKEHNLYIAIAALFVFYSWHCLKQLIDTENRENEFIDELNKEQKMLEYRKSLLVEQRNNLDRRNAALDQREKSLDDREASIGDAVRQRVDDAVQRLAYRKYLFDTPAFRAIRTKSDPGRVISSLTQSMQILAPFNITAKIKSESGNTYDTTLHHCTCRDFALHRKPCKHMYRLAVEVGALLTVDTTRQKEHLLNDLEAAQQKPPSKLSKS